MNRRTRFGRTLRQRTEADGIRFFHQIDGFLSQRYMIPGNTFYNRIGRDTVFQLHHHASGRIFDCPQQMADTVLIQLLDDLRPKHVIPDRANRIPFGPQLGSMVYKIDRSASGTLPRWQHIPKEFAYTDNNRFTIFH